MCFVSCSEKNTPNDEGNGGNNNTEYGSPSMNMADYVGTWKYEGDAMNSDIIDYVQLKANGTAIFHNTGNMNGDFWHGKWEIKKVTWAEKSTIGLYTEVYYNDWYGADLIGVGGIAISGAEEILEMGENKIKASDYGFDNIFYLVKVSDSTMDNLLNNWEYKDEWLLFGE